MSSDIQNPMWYAIQTRSNFERRVCSELADRGVESYCAAFREGRQWADRKKIIERPLFPGYVFARFEDCSEARLRVQKTAGAVRILGNQNRIEPVPEIEIESIRKMLESKRGCMPHPFLKEGSRVRVRRGALKNAEGILLRHKNEARLVMSINLLCKSIATEVDLADVETIPSSR